MDDLEEIRRRMAKRHHGSAPKKVLGDRQFSRVYRFSVITMGLCAFCLGIASYAKQNPQAMAFLSEHIPFSEAARWVDGHILNMIPFLNDTSKTSEVSGPVSYEALGNHTYQALNHEISSLEAGIVTSVSETGIVVLQDDGVSAAYDGLSEVEVALYDHVSQGERLGKCEHQFSMELTKDGQEVAYEDYTH